MHHAYVAVVAMVRHKAVSPGDCSWRKDGIYPFIAHDRGYIFGGKNVTEIHKYLYFVFGEIVMGIAIPFHYNTGWNGEYDNV